MPRPPRRSKSRRAGYGEEHFRHLLEGVALCPGHGFRIDGHDHDEPAMREAWEVLRDTLLPEFIQENPGTRPYAWWRYDAPERRQRTDGIQHPFDNRLRKSHVDKAAQRNPSFRETAYRLYYGRPNCLCVHDDFEAKYETELSYLMRLNLLTDTERETLEL